ncbi:MAG: putative transport system permease protein [Sphingomonadales bacterium]|nr:putative transport system permease protein [Sphingomonadales bacterium]
MRDLLAGASMLLRRLQGSPAGTLFPLLSLALGISGFLVLVGMADHELSYDRWVPARERIFRFETTISPAGAPPVRTVSVSARAGAMLASHLDGLEATARILPRTVPLTIGSRHLTLDTALTEPGFLRMFPLRPVAGNVAEALSRPDRIAVSRSTAEKLFGSTDVVGQAAQLADGRAVAVAGVFEDLPRNSHMRLEAVASLRASTFADLASLEKDWLDLGGYFYVKVKQPTRPEVLSNQATQLLLSEAPMLKSGGITATIAAFPLKELHVRHSPAGALPIGGFKPLLEASRVVVLVIVAIFLACLSAFNYAFHLATWVTRRAREIALRQFLGANPSSIYRLFLGEALLSIGMALAIALLMVALTHGWWARFSEGEPSFPDVAASRHAPLVYLGLFGLSALVALFPYLLARRVRPAETLRNRAAANSIRGRVVGFVMTVQIALAAALMVGAVSVAKQVALLNAAPLGFDAGEILISRSIPPGTSPSKIDTLLRELARSDAVSSAAIAQDEVGVGLVRAQANVEAPSLPHEMLMNYMAAGPGWFDLMRINAVAGRLLEDREADQLRRPAVANPSPAPLASVVLNESAARSLGYSTPQKAVGTTLTATLDVGWRQPFIIVGVVRDIAHASLREGPKPYFYFDQRDQENILYVRATRAGAEAVPVVEGRLRAAFPAEPPAVARLTHDISVHYEDEIRLRTVLIAGTLCVLAISLAGVAALARAVLAYRTREVAIRKVFGASPRDILSLVAWQFSWPIVIGYAIGAAVSWFLVVKWLNGFTLRDPPGALEFTAVLVVVVAACALVSSVFVGRLLRLRPATVLHVE